MVAKELSNYELVVSFLNLPAYITDEEIIEKLRGMESDVDVACEV